MNKILLVEDDAETIKLLHLYFHSQMYDVTSCNNGADAIQAIHNSAFDLIVLDITLPDITGLEICKQLRDEGYNIPVIMLTSHAEETSKVLALDLGADDYVTKPFGSLELMSRVKALLRRANQSYETRTENSNKISYKDIVIDAGKREATLKGERLHLTHKEFDILWLMAANPGKTFNRAELLEYVWGEKFAGYINTVTVHINRLRNKLEMDVNKPEYILTSWGTGYRFSG